MTKEEEEQGGGGGGEEAGKREKRKSESTHPNSNPTQPPSKILLHTEVIWVRNGEIARVWYALSIATLSRLM